MPTPINIGDIAKVAAHLASKALNPAKGAGPSTGTSEEKTMPEITQTILTAIGSDLSIDTMNVCIDVETKGILRKKKILHVFGTVRSQDQIQKVEQIARRHAGNAYEVVNHLELK